VKDDHVQQRCLCSIWESWIQKNQKIKNIRESKSFIRTCLGCISSEPARQAFNQTERSGAKPKIKGVSTGKKYKPVDQKVRPAMAYAPEELRVERFEVGDPLHAQKAVPIDPPQWKPVGRYTAERREEMAKRHLAAGMTPTEGRILDWMVSQCDTAFA
jgi:hypothetical protein